jgi:8-oxo-dGTP pyrophosphatase MutT (NUDIX family)
MTPMWRPTARILVVDPDGRVLLFSSVNGDGKTWWFTPGGGLRRGETVTEAAVRELAEETGFVAAEAELGPVVATSASLWTGDDGQVFLGAHSFFFLRVSRAEIDTDEQEEFERSFITGHRWWTAEELRSATDRIVPPALDDLIGRLLRGEVPDRPVRLPSS